jgi:hypothetical protein
MSSAREQFTAAIRIDPAIMRELDQGGVTAHVLGARNYPELCFEMARVYARTQDLQAMRIWLARASEGGYDVRHAMQEEAVFHPYINDAQVKLILENARQLQKRSVAATSTPSLGASQDTPHRILLD